MSVLDSAENKQKTKTMQMLIAYTTLRFHVSPMCNNNAAFAHHLIAHSHNITIKETTSKNDVRTCWSRLPADLASILFGASFREF